MPSECTVFCCKQRALVRDCDNYHDLMTLSISVRVRLFTHVRTKFGRILILRETRQHGERKAVHTAVHVTPCEGVAAAVGARPFSCKTW